MCASTSSSTWSPSPLADREESLRCRGAAEGSSEGAGEAAPAGTKRRCCTWMVKMAWDLLEEAFILVAATALLLMPR